MLTVNKTKQQLCFTTIDNKQNNIDILKIIDNALQTNLQF